MKASAVLRVARPTDYLAAIAEMYATGLDFTVLAQFEDHDGFDALFSSIPSSSTIWSSQLNGGHQVGKAPTEDH
jgi:YycE-like N-terminal domain